MKVMLLDGQYSHSTVIGAELVRDLGAEVLGVAPSARAPLHRSRYVTERLTAPLSSDPDYVPRVLELVMRFKPDLVIPVGYNSFRRLINSRPSLPSRTRLLAPSQAAFDVAESKELTYALAENVGVCYPRDLSLALSQSDARDALRFPIFAKARLERGGVSTAFLRDRDALESLDIEELGGDVLLQEFIGAEPYTYAHGGFYAKGQPIVTFQHKEIRSVPRRGGSGTRLRTYHDPELAEQANSLLAALAWDGVAQVEFKKNEVGEYVLMEINPKFWASYALASRAGARIAAAAAASFGGVEIASLRRHRRRTIEMVFPIREGIYAVSHRKEESMLRSVGAMVWPPACWDIDITDLYAAVPLRLRSRPSPD